MNFKNNKIMIKLNKKYLKNYKSNYRLINNKKAILKNF